MKKLKHFLTALIMIPLNPENWLDLQYKDIKANKVQFPKSLMKVDVHQSASPLFYKFDKPIKIESFSISGNLEIKKEINIKKDDRYLQLGLIYQGDYKPHFISSFFLPEWIETLLQTYDKKGLGEIAFYGPSPKKKEVRKIRDLKMSFYDSGEIKDKKIIIKAKPLKKKKVIGLWLRADGDNSSAQFQLKINQIKIETKD